MSSSITHKATLANIEVDTADSQRIKAIEAEAHRYPNSPVFQQTVDLLKKQIKPQTEQVVTLTMSREEAWKLYGLLGQITKHSGFDPLFQALNNAPFVLIRVRPKLTFVGDNVLNVEF